MNFTIGIEALKGRLRLRLPRSAIMLGTNRYISLGLDDTSENRKKAQLKAWEIEADLANGLFDATLQKYTNKGQSIRRLSLLELWDAYTEHKAKILAYTTIQATYKRRIRNVLIACGNGSIKTWLSANKSPYTTRLILQHLSSAYDWGIDAGLVATSPLSTKAYSKIDHKQMADPFSAKERDAIIEGFANSKHYAYYTSFVKFLFLTGCRPGEAIALKWLNVASGDAICFSVSYNSRFSLLKDTKTHESRYFPINSQLQTLLTTLPPGEVGELVFPSPRNGGFINGHCFSIRAWKTTLTKLCSEGSVKRYRCLYQTRSTFISQCLEAGITPQQIAKWCGNTPTTIMRHYAGVANTTPVPEL